MKKKGGGANEDEKNETISVNEGVGLSRSVLASLGSECGLGGKPIGGVKAGDPLEYFG